MALVETTLHKPLFWTKELCKIIVMYISYFVLTTM